MTQQELMDAVAMTAKELPLAGIRLLLHLIATGNKEGTNEIRTSTRTLAKELKCSPDKAREAAHSLKPYLEVGIVSRSCCTFHMPSEWFEQSRWLSMPFGRVEKSGICPGNQGRSALETSADGSLGAQASALETRADGRTGGEYQGRCKRTGGEYQGSTALETRAAVTQNQQLTDTADVSIDRSYSLNTVLLNTSIEDIACAKLLKPEQKEEARQLSDFIHFYMREYGTSTAGQQPPDEEILAKCLAIAPLSSLIRILRKLQNDGTPAGDRYIWFVYTFCQRAQGIPGKALHAAQRRVAIRDRRRPQQNLDFSTRMTDEIRHKARRIS